MNHECRFAFTQKQACIFLCLLTTTLSLTFLPGCHPDRKGTAAINLPPQIHIVNTPPSGAQFSRNPEIKWYGTDIDGYIVLYRYAVVLDSMLVIDGTPVSPEIFAESAPDDQFGWRTLYVDLDHPQASAVIRLYANIDFPVDSFVTQYFFVQAQDDKGAMSRIIWRRYSRNNHYPNTHFGAGEYFINAPDETSPAPGIVLSWTGADSVDWGRTEPPLEYEWRLYGPYEVDAPIYIREVEEDCVYDPTTGSMINCRTVHVLDLERLPPAIQNLPQPLRSSRGPNFIHDPDDVWVTETQTTIYDVYRDLDVQETIRCKFVFWVRARDDGFVPDPTPPFDQFHVYEAMFESSVMVVDETRFDYRSGKWSPVDIDTAKACFYNFIRGAGYDDFDTIYDSTRTRKMHYFYSTDRRNTVGTIFPNTNARPTLLDVLSHRVIIFYNDDTEGGPDESQFGLLRRVFEGMDMGASGWIMSRNLGNSRWLTPPGTIFGKSAEFRQKFGISEVVCEGWLKEIILDYPDYEFTEQYIGAHANVADYPNLTVDRGAGCLTDTRYPRMSIDPDYVLIGCPEVGIGTRTQYALPLYLYLSVDGDQSFYHGKVNAVYQNVGGLRSACFMFTPLVMEPDAMQEVFIKMLDWLGAGEDGPSETYAKASQYSLPGYAELSERRKRIDSFLKYISESDDPDLKAWYGVDNIQPYRIIGLSDK